MDLVALSCTKFTIRDAQVLRLHLLLLQPGLLSLQHIFMMLMLYGKVSTGVCLDLKQIFKYFRSKLHVFQNFPAISFVYYFCYQKEINILYLSVSSDLRYYTLVQSKKTSLKNNKLSVEHWGNPVIISLEELPLLFLRVLCFQLLASSLIKLLEIPVDSNFASFTPVDCTKYFRKVHIKCHLR